MLDEKGHHEQVAGPDGLGKVAREEGNPENQFWKLSCFSWRSNVRITYNFWVFECFKLSLMCGTVVAVLCQ